MDLKKLTWQKFYYKLNKLNVNYTDESIESMLNHAADDMKKGILKFKPHASTRLVFYKSDKPDTDYLYPIISQLLFIDENDAKSIYDKYTENEGEDGTNKGLTENDLHNVCINVWNFYNEELLFLFRSLKYILTAVENPNYHYSAVCKKFARKQNWKEWYSALQDQLSYVRSITFFDTIVYKPLQKIVHKNLLTFILNQQIEILQLMVLTSLRVNKLTKDDFNTWINNLIDNNFGKNQTLEYDYNNLNTTYAALMCQISSLETLHSLQMICLFWEYDNYIWTSDEEFIESDKKIKMIQHSSEYGAVLMAWAILNLKGQYGIKDLQKLDVYTDIMSPLKLWPSLLNMCQSPVVKDHTITDKLARILCENLIIESIDLDIFDLIDYDPLLIKLLLYLLSKNSELSSETINNLESGIGLFIKKFMGMYPVDLCSLFDLFIGIIKGSPQNLNKVWQLMNNIKTFNAVFPPDGRYIYDQESDTFYLTDKYFVTDVVCNIEIPSNTTFISDGDMVQFDYKVPVFYFLNSAINNFRMCRDGDKKNASYNVTKDMLISSIELIQTISKVATSLNDDLMGTCETLLTLIPSVSYIDSNYIADSMIVSKVLKLARCILVYFPEQTMCYFNANNFFPSLVSGIEDAVVNLHPFAQNSVGLMILKNGPDIYPVLTQYIKFVEAAFKIKHVLTSQCAIAGLMFVFKSIMPLLTMSDFFMGPKEKMDLRWSCLRLIYVISVLDSGNSTLLSPVKKVLDLCLVHSPSSIASLIILNISTIGEKDFIKVMHNYHSWTSGIGKRNIQSLIFALSLLNYIINSKQITEVKQEKNIAMFDPERRLSNLLSYRLTVFHNKLNVLSLTILGTLAEKRFVSFSLSMGFDNDKRARKEMLSYLKLHRLHSVNIVKMLRFLHNAISYQCKMFEIILNVELLEQCIKNKKRIENNDDSILWFIELELETDDFKQEQENHVYLETLGIIHTLWYNRFNLAMNYLEQNNSFWKLIFKPLFHNKMIPEINSEIISILSLQAHSCSIENKNEFSEQLDIFLKTRLNSMLKSFLLYFDENKTEEANDIKRKLLYSWKFFTLLVLKNKNNVVSDKYQVVENVLKMFIMELKSEDLSLITSLGECLLIMLQMWKKNCVQKNKTSYINIKTILRLVNKNETLIKNQPSKTTVLIVVNEITSIIFSDITLNNDEEEDLLNEIYSEICELTEQHLNCIEENNHDYHSYLINLRLVNALFYKSIPAVIKSSNWHKSYLLTNAIVQMFSHTEKNYRDNNVNSITVEVTDFLLYLSTFKEFHSQFGTQPAIIKQLCTLLSAKSITSDFNGVETKYDDFKRMEVYSNYYKILTNFLINCDDCVKKEAIKYLTTIYNDLATILNFPNSMKLSTLHLSLVQSVIKLMDLMVSKSYYFHWKSLGGSCFIALEKCIISIWECAYGSYTQLNDPDKLIMSMFKKEKVQLNLTGWKTRGDIFSGQDLKMINETRKILFEMLYCCNAILARIMVPPYEIVSLLQLGKTDAVLFKNIMCDEVILDQKFSTFCTIEELVNIVVFISDKITRHGTISTSLISALNERYVLDVDVTNLNNALELCIYIFTSQLLMKTLQNNDNHKYLNEISDIAKNMSLLLYRTISKDLEERKITLVDIRSQQSIGDGSDDLLIGFMKLLEFIKDIHRSSTTLNHNFRTVYASYY
ncbi:nucleoporin Nup188 [Daktulosphaira vitifoliae]|uniref:nucleoporin Nup188 n=1 Tax=Daktulosphaira vitifoliae TaxID=58002 RepID=UPI0021AA6EF6|nr:nucleoporin Nup188 [Daktulosphaira vitifoliae]